MDLKNLLREFINGGWIIPIIGAFGMIARMLNSKVDYCWKQYMRNILSAAILSGISLAKKYAKNPDKIFKK